MTNRLTAQTNATEAPNGSTNTSMRNARATHGRDAHCDVRCSCPCTPIPVIGP